MPKVDVIIPFFNTPVPYVRSALESVLAQTYPDWKAILINDGSDKACSLEMEGLIDSCGDSRLLYVKIPHKGSVAARNAGIRRSDAPYIALLDSDDVWYPWKLERQLLCLDAHPGIDVLHSDSLLIDSSGCVIRRPDSKGSKSFLNDLSREQLFQEMLRQNFVWSVTGLFRRSAGEAVGYFDEGFDSLDDKEFWVRLLHRGSLFFYQDEVVAMYRVHGSNKSKSIERIKRGRLRLIEKVDAMIQDHPSGMGINRTKNRRQMTRRMHRELSERYLEQGQYLKSLRYSLPFYSGLSLDAGLLTLRSLYRLSGLRRVMRTNNDKMTNG